METDSGQVFDTVFIDGAGNFRFDELSGGERFFVSVSEPGFRPARIEVTTGPFSMRSEVMMLESVVSDADVDNPFAVDLSELLAEIPVEAIEAFERADDESRKGNYRRAAEHLEEAVALAPEFYEAQNALGVAYEELDRNEDAIDQFRIGRDLSPNSPAPALSLGALYLRQADLRAGKGQLAEAGANLGQALENLQEAERRNPRSGMTQYYLGATWYRAGDLEAATENFNRALALNSQIHEARLMLINVFIGRREPEAALAQAVRYLDDYPDSPAWDDVRRTRAELERQASAR
jgi:tetratricopeptide (TPR) repeat protein